MPTNVLRHSAGAQPAGAQPKGNRPHLQGERVAVLTAGPVSIRISLSQSETANRIWAALPLHSTVETWGNCVHFETPLETGRDRTARINGVKGEIYFWIEQDRILIPFGPSPISRSKEWRLPQPCNVWAVALDDVTALEAVEPGQKASLVAAPIAAT